MGSGRALQHGTPTRPRGAPGNRLQRKPLHLDREYVKCGIRNIAENLCTKQLGYRTEFDAAMAERREVGQHRYTSLDRMITRAASANTNTDTNPRFFTYTQEPSKSGIRDGRALRQQHTIERLLALQTMGLAECTGTNTWLVRRDFESVLRAMQRMDDHQKTLEAHGVLLSDERLQVAGTLPGRTWKGGFGRERSRKGRLPASRARPKTWALNTRFRERKTQPRRARLQSQRVLRVSTSWFLGRLSQYFPRGLRHWRGNSDFNT